MSEPVDDCWKKALFAFAEDCDEEIPPSKKNKASNISDSESDLLYHAINFSEDGEESRKRAATASSDKSDGSDTKSRMLESAPYFFYRDFSKEKDDDPLTSLTPPGCQPSFPAKMHDILSCSDFADIISWLPHGRAWRILNPRVFEKRVIPLYFEHTKFSSFIRQTNGWGFRRIKNGCDRNAYYHERFLRGLPYLSKKMKRLGVAEKNRANPDHEPDFYTISKDRPVPDKASADDGILIDGTLRSIGIANQSLNTDITANSVLASAVAQTPSALCLEPTPLAPSIHKSSTSGSSYAQFNQGVPETAAATNASLERYHQSYLPLAQAQTENVFTASLATNTQDQDRMAAFQLAQAPYYYSSSAQNGTSNPTSGAHFTPVSESLPQAAAAGYLTEAAANVDKSYSTMAQNWPAQTYLFGASSATADQSATSLRQSNFSSSGQDFQDSG